MCCTVPAGIRVAHCDHWAQLRFREAPSSQEWCNDSYDLDEKRCELHRLALSEFQVQEQKPWAPSVVDPRQKIGRGCCIRDKQGHGHQS
jgi:hypothetical protein